MIYYQPGHHKDHGFPHDPFKAIISPRPIGWISTVNKDGKANLAPYSFFNAVASDPPCVMFSSGSHPDTLDKKDTQRNIEENGEFVCNIVSYEQREQMNESSIHLPYGESEIEYTGLEGIPSTQVKPPRVKGAPVHLECKYLQSVQMPCWREGHENWVVFGEVIGVHIDPSVVENGEVNVLKYNPVARLGYFDFTSVTELFDIARPDQDKKAITG